MIKTTKQHFELFKQECEYWIDKLGIECWKILFEHSDDVGEDALANVTYRTNGRIAIIALNKHWRYYETIDDQTLQQTAFHEITELLLANSATMMKSQFGCSEEAIDMEQHIIIRTLENTLFKDDFERRMVC